jgi:SAM-dependent methyltransferase
MPPTCIAMAISDENPPSKIMNKAETMNKIGILIQAAATNWNGGDDFSIKELDGQAIFKTTYHRCVEFQKYLSESGQESEICFVLPDRKRERGLYEEFFADNNIRHYFGDEYDVLNRLICCCDKRGFESVYRVNAAFWYLDLNISHNLFLQFIKSDYDLAKLPPSFPHGFAGEFITVSSLKNLKASSSNIVTNPVVNMTQEGSFNIFEYLPEKDAILPDLISFIRHARLQYEPERAEQIEASLYEKGSIYYSIYNKAIEFIDEHSLVLDIASGAGLGSCILARKAKYVYGGDYNLDVIRSCTQTKIFQDNLSFIHADLTSLPFKDEYFDVVVSMETVEHVDELLFVSNISRVLKRGGYLVLSTPQNNYNFNLTPWHIKEYDVKGIRRLLEDQFLIQKIYGCSSSCVLENTEDGDRMLVVARKR